MYTYAYVQYGWIDAHAYVYTYAHFGGQMCSMCIHVYVYAYVQHGWTDVYACVHIYTRTVWMDRYVSICMHVYEYANVQYGWIGVYMDG